MAYVVWKIFLKQYARFSFDATSPDFLTRYNNCRAIKDSQTTSSTQTSTETPSVVNDDDGKCLSEVLVVNDTKVDTLSPISNSINMMKEASLVLTSTGQSQTNNNHNTNANAPIARVEDVDESEINRAENNESASVTIAVGSATTVRRSKSRVRTYLRKCKERLTGHQHQQQKQQQTVASQIVSNGRNVDIEKQLTAFDEGEEELRPNELTSLPLENSLHGAMMDPYCFSVSLNAVDEDDNGSSYEDIDFGLSTVEIKAAAKVAADEADVTQSDLLAEIDASQAEMWREQQALALQFAKEKELDTGIAKLIDVYLSPIYPVYSERTRAVLINQARDLLISHYDSSFQAFERLFLSKSAEIAAILKEKHVIGESVVWHKGWPLATLAGEVILHLGALDDALLKPSELYLCIKTVGNSPPQLYAVWRSAQSNNDNTTNSIQCRCIDHSDPKAYLSIFNLEMMLSDDLPQLLQNLLVGVENAIGRLAIKDLALPNFEQQQQQNLLDSPNNNKTITGLASPKCGLKRSELITKNKMLNNKFMLRRLTNRQDSMTSTSSGNSCSSTGSSISSDELARVSVDNKNNNNSNNNNNNNTYTTSVSVSPALPLFCLGNSFPHIDSDEENADEKRNSLECDDSLSQEIVAPRAICEIPEKLLSSGIYLPGTRDLNGRSLVTIDADCLLISGLNCYEIATVLLYYSTLPESLNDNFVNNVQQQQLSHSQHHQQHIAAVVSQKQPQQQQPAQPMFTILIAIEKANHLTIIDLICQSLKLLARHIEFCEILAVCLDRSLLQLGKQHTDRDNSSSTSSTNTNNNNIINKNNQQQPQHQQQQSLLQPLHSVKFISVDEVTTSVAPSQIPRAKLSGQHYHEPRKWREFFALCEPFQSQCLASGQRLVTAINEIRCADMQGLPTRRQLYTQHRALSRALMDSELHNVRKRGSQTLTRLQELARGINDDGGQTTLTSAVATIVAGTSTSATATTKTTATKNHLYTNNGSNIDVAIRLNKVMLLFNEVDRAAKRLEQLTEQRRERLRELTRQRALEDEINEVTSWMTSDGNETLQRFSNLQLDCETSIKEHEQEFEKYYFVSMKHLAKGRDLHEAAICMEALHESASNLKAGLDCFAEKLEQARERIEGASRLHQLLSLHDQIEDNVQMEEILLLVEKFGVPGLLERYRLKLLEREKNRTEHRNSSGSEKQSRIKPNTLNLNHNLNLGYGRHSYNTTNQNKPNNLLTSTPIQKSERTKSNISVSASGIGSGSGTGGSDGPPTCHCWRESRNVEDVDAMLGEDDEDAEEEEEEQSKIADSGLGGCDRCEGNPKLSRICSCQSLNEAGNLYDKGHNSDELDDECFERPSKRFLNIHSPMEANSHLQCHASNLELPKMEELSCLDPKIQKTLLLIMREMIGTERDYVRSLYYVIENYVDELLRDDIPQPLRGQRNVIFGNIEKIFEFHNSHFVSELERYEHNPLKVGAAFLEMESKFYLYALYNKNKPKSDTLLSEYGTIFFKSKQMELNDKMDLASYLLKPVQRMGKYALLLQQLVKACSSVQGAAMQEIAADVEELQRAEEMVKFQLRHGNDLLAMDSLRDCDVNVKEQGRLMRQNEFLVWQGRGGKKTLRQIFLFEELVLFSKARRFPDHKNLDIYLYKNSIKTSDIGLTAHVGESTTKFEIWFRKRKPEDTWTLQCMSEDIKNAWTEEISKLLWKQAKRNRDIRLAEMSSMGIGSKPCLDIRPSNNQINDRSITISQLGKAPKLRNSFVGLHAENNKTSKRPNSLISESSLSSGTSSSSTSTGSSASGGGGGGGGVVAKHGINSNSNAHHHHHGLELINETQALMLATGETSGSSNTNTTNTMSSTTSSAASGNLRNHKRSTTLVSQLSMESGILSDISMTPDQEQTPIDSAMSWTTTSGVIMRRKVSHVKNIDEIQSQMQQKQPEFNTAAISEDESSYVEERSTEVNF